MNTPFFIIFHSLFRVHFFSIYPKFYGYKVWHSNSKYKRTIWQCNNKFNGDKKCNTLHLYEEDIKAEFIKQFNKLIENKDEILDNCRLIQAALTHCTKIDKQIADLLSEIDVVSELVRKCVQENSESLVDQNEYLTKYEAHVKRYETAKAKLENLQNIKHQRLSKRDSIGAFMFELMERYEVITEFDERLFGVVVEKVVVRASELEVEFRNK